MKPLKWGDGLKHFAKTTLCGFGIVAACVVFVIALEAIVQCIPGWVTCYTIIMILAVGGCYAVGAIVIAMYEQDKLDEEIKSSMRNHDKSS